MDLSPSNSPLERTLQIFTDRGRFWTCACLYCLLYDLPLTQSPFHFNHWQLPPVDSSNLSRKQFIAEALKRICGHAHISSQSPEYLPLPWLTSIAEDQKVSVLAGSKQWLSPLCLRAAWLLRLERGRSTTSNSDESGQPWVGCFYWQLSLAPAGRAGTSPICSLWSRRLQASLSLDNGWKGTIWNERRQGLGVRMQPKDVFPIIVVTT